MTVFDRRIAACVVLTLVLIGVAGLTPRGAQAQAQVPRASLPAFLTSGGQSPDAFMVKVLCDRSNIKVDYDALAGPERLAGVKTLIFAIGGSAKGLGAAGIDEEEELQRIKSLLDKAKELAVFVVGIHVGGEARRGPLSAKFIELVAPQCHYLVVKEDGNKDGYFTKLGAERKIPVTIIEETLQLADILKRMFPGE